MKEIERKEKKLKRETRERQLPGVNLPQGAPKRRKKKEGKRKMKKHTRESEETVRTPRQSAIPAMDQLLLPSLGFF